MFCIEMLCLSITHTCDISVSVLSDLCRAKTEASGSTDVLSLPGLFHISKKRASLNYFFLSLPNSRNICHVSLLGNTWFR